MTFFYDLNKRLADLAKKQTLAEDKGSKPDFLDLDKDGNKKESMKKAVANKDGMEESALQAFIGKKKYGEQGMKALQQAGRDGVSKDKMSQIRNRYNKMDEADMEEGNEFSGELVKARAQGSKEFKVDGKSYPVKEGAKPDYIDLDKDGNKKESMKKAAADKKKSKSTGTAFDLETAKSMFANKDDHPRYNVKDTGYSKVYTRKSEEPTDDDTDSEASSDAPKRRGRPKGKDKGPERVTAKSYKYKSGRPTKTKEDLDSDGVMMTRPSNMSSEDIESISLINKGEYDQEGDMAKKDLKSLAMAAKELHGILSDDQNLPEWVQSKITKALDYINSSNQYMHQEQGSIAETYNRTKDDLAVATSIIGNLMRRSNKGETINPKELVDQLKLLQERVNRLAGGPAVDTLRPETKPVTEKAVSQKQQRFMGMAHAMQKGDKIKGASPELKKVAKTMNKSDVTDFAKTKHEGLPKKAKTEETVEAPKEKKSKSGYDFGGSVYESYNKQFTKLLNEGMNITVNMSTDANGQPNKNITVSADGDDADTLAAMLKMAGIGRQEEACSSCGNAPCGCAEVVDENSPDYPTNTETSDNAFQYSGGLNGPKSTGQTTVPVVASQASRLHSMEESVKIERSLFKLYKDFK